MNTVQIQWNVFPCQKRSLREQAGEILNFYRETPGKYKPRKIIVPTIGMNEFMAAVLEQEGLPVKRILQANASGL